jgi:hypothetical protein
LAYDTLPSRSGDEVRASIATAANIRSSIDEYVQGNASAMEASSLRDLADKPLVVLTADIGNPADHMAKQDALAALSTTSVHRVVHGASHSSLIMAEEDAVSTTRAILDVVSSVRGNAPLTP